MDVALLQYISGQLKQGITAEEITRMLLDQGWPLEAIDQGFKYVATHPNQVDNHSQIFSNKLKGPLELLREAYLLVRNHIWTLLFLSLIPTAISATFAAGSVLYFFIISRIPGIENFLDSTPYVVLSVVLFGIYTLASSYISIWSYIAMYEVLASYNTEIRWRDAMRRSAHKVIPFFWVMFLYGLITFGGYMLLIVPGLILTLRFMFAPYVYLLENENGMNALLKSKEYSSGQNNGILFRSSFFTIIVIAVSIFASVAESVVKDNSTLLFIVKIVLAGINMFITPLAVAYFYLLFENIRAIKGILPVRPRKKAGYIAIGIVGTVIFMLLLFYALRIVLKSISRFNKAATTEMNMKMPRIDLDELSKQSNDKLRVTDIHAIQTALIKYREAYEIYPATLNDTKLAEFLTYSPTDPVSDLPYSYEPLAGGDAYQLCAVFETEMYPEYSGKTCFSRYRMVNTNP